VDKGDTSFKSFQRKLESRFLLRAFAPSREKRSWSHAKAQRHEGKAEEEVLRRSPE
jgi:hypothetical protein